MLKRILCSLLASVLLIGSLAACAESQEQPENDSVENTAQSAGPGTSADATEGQTKETLDIPDTRYNDQTLTFLTRTNENDWNTTEIYAEELTSDTDNINNAVYERNLRIRETYGVTIKDYPSATGSHMNTVQLEISGGTGDFQAIITQTNQSASMSTNGYLWDLYADEITGLDFSKSWWDARMVAGLSIDHSLYFATGDLLTSDNDATFCLLFNKEIAKDNQAPDMYAMVENYQWTMEKFYEVSAQCTKDLDGLPGLAYDKDIIGFAYTDDGPYCFLFSGGITLCTKDADDIPVYGLDVERASNISDMGKRLFDKTHALHLNTLGFTKLSDAGKATFGGNKAMFIGEVMQTVTRMRGYDVEFGILPFPMYDTSQGTYQSMMHYTASMVSIPKTVIDEKLEMTCNMIEAMAYHSVDTLTTQYYEINLKSKGAKDEQSAPMIDMILASRICDLSYYYRWGNNAFDSFAKTLRPDGAGTVSSYNKKFSRLIPKDIDTMLEKIEEFKNAG